MIDFHSHILPAIDDGSKSIDETMALLQAAKSQGLDAVIATPHFYPDRDTPEHFLAEREKAVEKLRGKEMPLPVYIGAEVAFFIGMGSYENLASLAIEGTKVILIEMPFCKWSPTETEEILKIAERGFTPVLAHIERYIDLHNKKALRFFAACDNIYLQSNANFFLRKKTSRRALRYLKKGMIHLIGSDCHSVSERPENLGEAVDMLASNGQNELLTKIEKRSHRLTDGATLLQ